MNKTTSRYAALTALTVVLAPIAFALAPNAATTAQNATSAVNASQVAAQQSVAATHAATANQAAQGATNAAANSPAVTGATSTGAAATTAAGATIPSTRGTVNAGMSNSATSDPSRGATASSQAGLNGTARAPGLNGTASGQIAVSLNATETATQIRNASGDTRDSVLTRVDSTITTTHRSLAELRERGSQLSGDARTQFKNAYEQVRLREQALRESLRHARQASADTYASSQAQLASDYEAYAQAVAAAEAAGTVSTHSPSMP